MKMNTEKLARGLALIAGAMDLATGAGLVAAPAWTLGWMQVATPVAEALVFLRWVGAFVGAVGASYLLALARGGAGRLREVLVTTILFRCAAGGYCLWAVATGELEPRWALVAGTDFGLVAAQAWLLKREGWGDE
jgi:hypothetical protein